MRKVDSYFLIYTPPLEQNTMHRLVQNKGAYLGGTGTVGSGL